MCSHPKQGGCQVAEGVGETRGRGPSGSVGTGSFPENFRAMRGISPPRRGRGGGGEVGRHGPTGGVRGGPVPHGTVRTRGQRSLASPGARATPLTASLLPC